MLTLALKLLLAPALVVGSTLAGRRWGPRVGGVLVCLPVVAGPILLVVWLQHGATFAAGTARAAMLGIVPLALFAVVVAGLSRRHGLVVTVLGAWLVVLAADALLTRLHVPAWVALLLALAALHGAGLVLRRHAPTTPVPRRAPAWDLPARAAATALLVLVLTGLAGALGPTVTGVLSSFPVAQTVVCGFALVAGGHAAVVALLRGIVPGLDGFALYLFVSAVTLDRLPAAASFGLALLAAAVVAAALLVVPVLRSRSSYEPAVPPLGNDRHAAASLPILERTAVRVFARVRRSARTP